MRALGKLDWAFSGGRSPFLSQGKEPEFISHDKIAILNTSQEEVLVEFFIFYENEQPFGTYEVKVGPERLRKVRFNELIDPAAIQLDRNYGCLIKANHPIVVQFSRMDTGTRSNAGMSTMAFSADQ